ncbi:uncharacterized protein SPSK_06619 [Sporothrix schenckii 1099-18]|uniref:Uncharacterized protein n=2 Tax=Sporothrix schenckii TaxID=29908 RepID=U7PTS2_SPOS1|nr:uncharacterized protein SPSK_06619 [Sporothrix schenckii 1099-18]ERS98154.1 hypothetical protein HMPREF1624_04935 [Sporothrix schenckii ATCC 58251]KJR89749.1 hypothetical protein SPSK_06619 [Sporothrix schenckii 1099-18]
MLLTSSQVSVAVSASIVILCTFALFISGYVLQQRTLRQLRQSIRMPKPEPPKIFLPDRFNKMTTELADGTIVTIETDVDENGNAIIVADNAPSQSQASPLVGGPRNKDHNDIVVEVTPSRPGAEDQTQQRLAGDKAPREQNADGMGVVPEEVTQKQKPTSKPVSKAERRRLIKEELMKMGANEKPNYYQRRLH